MIQEINKMAILHGAEEFIVSHLKTIEQFEKVSDELFITIETNGIYSVIFANNPDKKYITKFDSTEYYPNISGRFVIFYPRKNKKYHYLWNQDTIFYTKYKFEILDAKGDSAIVLSDDVKKTIWFVKLNSEEKFRKITLQNMNKEEILLFSEDEFIHFSFRWSEITFRFYDFECNLKIETKYSAEYDIYKINIANTRDMILVALISDKNDFNIVRLTSDYGIIPEKVLKWMKYEHFEADILNCVLYCNKRKIIKYDPKDITQIKGEFCFYMDWEILKNSVFDDPEGARKNKHIVIRRYTDASVRIFDQTLYSALDDVFVAKDNKEKIYHVYKVQLCDQYFTKPENFYKLVMSKKQTIYMLMLIYQYSNSEISRLPFEILLYLFVFA